MATTPSADPTTPSSKRVGPGRALVIGLGLATLVGALFTVQAALSGAPDTRSSLVRAFLLRSTPWWGWALLAPLVFGALDRWSPLGAPLRRKVVAHALLAVLVSVVHVVITSGVVRIAGLTWTEAPVPDAIRRALLLGLFSDLLTFGLIAALFHVDRHVTALRTSWELVRWTERKHVEGIRALAGAVAHDLSNRLTVLRVRWRLLREDLDDLRDPSDETRSAVEELDSALVEVSDLIQHVSAIGTVGSPLRPRRLSVPELAEAVAARMGVDPVDAREARPSPPGSLEVEVDLDRLGSVIEVVRDSLRAPPGSPAPTLGVRSVEQTLSGSRASEASPRLVEFVFESAPDEEHDEVTLDPHLVESDGTVRSNLDLVAARATVLRMGGELSVAGGGFRLTLPLLDDSA